VDRHLSVCYCVLDFSFRLCSSFYDPAVTELQNQAADTQFALKAADIVLQSDDPEVNANKAARFQELFPHRVPSDWVKDFHWRQHIAESDDMKRDLVKLLADHPAQEPQIIALYKTLFVDDPTVQGFLSRIPNVAPKK
jgi:hypothetical protein